ncbi:MAG: aminotransferase class I/II-fold pyridoxal phosphate-dependent enzyme [Oscillospiraceae bacterium]|nr:aminotransferase class I/II-fold pyridoxal phosphate-dependent enzyme [Oscillospiraceae bacterium]
MIESLVKPGIRQIPPYIPGDTAESARRHTAQEILKLASNENQLGASPKALEAMRAAVPFAHVYPDPFCAGLRAKIGRVFGFADPADHVTISTGASGAIALLGEIFIGAGDEVIYCEPTFGAYAGAVRRNAGTPVVRPLTAAGAFDLDAMRAAVTDRTKMIFLCNPNNPTGGTVDPAALRAFVRGLPGHVVLAVDEAYIEFSDDPSASVVSEIAEGVNLVVLRTFSKLYGLAGMRIGYTLTNREIHSVLQRSTGVFVAGRLALAAADAALSDTDFAAESVRVVRAGRCFLTEALTEMGCRVYPSQANFLYVDTGYDPAALAAACKERGLIIRGNFAHTRITVGTPRQNGHAVEILRDVMASGVVPRAGTAPQAG